MQKHLDEASKARHEEIVSEETVMLRREDDESSMFPKPMADWKTSNQYKEIHELEANNIAMKGSPQRHGEIIGDVTLTSDRGEFSGEAIFAANSGIARN